MIVFGACGHPVRDRFLSAVDRPIARPPFCAVCALVEATSQEISDSDEWRFDRTKKRRDAFARWSDKKKRKKANECAGPVAPLDAEITNEALALVGAYLAGCGYTFADVPAWNERRKVRPLMGLIVASVRKNGEPIGSMRIAPAVGADVGRWESLVSLKPGDTIDLVGAGVSIDMPAMTVARSGMYQITAQSNGHLHVQQVTDVE